MELFEKLCTDADYIPNAHQSGQRALKLRVLDLLVYSDKEATIAKELFKSATNMTDEMGTLIVLLRHDKINEEIDDFYSRWSGNNLVIDKWFSVQATHTIPQKSIQMVKLLSEHTAFKWKNPNRFRSLIGSFSSGNQVPFNDKSGKGYEIVTDWLIKLDTVNPQTAARMSAVFDNWRIFDTKRQNIIKKNLERLINRINVSKNTYEIVNSILKSQRS
jgi:aminopeptidase N